VEHFIHVVGSHEDVIFQKRMRLLRSQKRRRDNGQQGPRQGGGQQGRNQRGPSKASATHVHRHLRQNMEQPLRGDCAMQQHCPGHSLSADGMSVEQCFVCPMIGPIIC
jgi:hypothetical protein